MTNNLKYNTAITAIGMIFFQISNFALAVYIVRAIGAAELGNYQLFIITATLLSYIAKLGLDEKLSYQLPTLNGAKTEQGRNIINQALNQSLIASVVVILLFVIVKFTLSEEPVDIATLSAYVIYFPSFVFTLVVMGILRAEQKINLRNLVLYVAPNIFNFIFILAISLLISAKSSSLLARAISYFIIAVGLYLFIRKHYGFTFKKPQRLSVASNGSWLVMTTCVFAIESGFIAIWYGKLYLLEAELGVFAILIRLASLVLLVPVALTVVIGPVFAKSPSNTALQKKTIFLNGLGVLLALAFLQVTAQYWLAFFGESYVQYQTTLHSLVVVMALFAFTQPMSSVLIANNKNSWIIYCTLIAFCVFGVAVFLQEVTLVNVITSFEYSMVAYSIVRLFMYGIYLYRIRNKTVFQT